VTLLVCSLLGSLALTVTTVASAGASSSIAFVQTLGTGTTTAKSNRRKRKGRKMANAPTENQVEMSRAWTGMWVVGFGDLAIAVAAVVVVFKLGATGSDITQVVAVLTSAFTAISTMTTAYFGIRSATNTAQSAVTGAGEQVRTAISGQQQQGPPTITALDPTSGQAGGGIPVYITGSGFTSDAVVKFGTTPPSSQRVVSSSLIVVTSPPGAAGSVPVTVETATGVSAPALFTYT
jgi:hypothetical protein